MQISRLLVKTALQKNATSASGLMCLMYFCVLHSEERMCPQKLPSQLLPFLLQIQRLCQKLVGKKGITNEESYLRVPIREQLFSNKARRGNFEAILKFLVISR